MDKLLAPSDLLTKDLNRLYDTVTDTKPLPGMLTFDTSSDALYDETAQNIKFSIIMLATTLVKNARTCVSNYIMGRYKETWIKGGEDQEWLFNYVKEVEECKTGNFEQQSDVFELFLNCWLYDTSVVEDYAEFGGLLRIIRESYCLYCCFLNIVSQLFHDYDEWVEGRGLTMLEYYSRKLLGTCLNVLSKRHLLLQIYVHLWDNNVKNNFHQSFNAILWNCISKVSESPNPTRVTQRCSWCKSQSLHQALGLHPYYSECPVLKRQNNLDTDPNELL